MSCLTELLHLPKKQLKNRIDRNKMRLNFKAFAFLIKWNSLLNFSIFRFSIFYHSLNLPASQIAMPWLGSTINICCHKELLSYQKIIKNTCTGGRPYIQAHKLMHSFIMRTQAYEITIDTILPLDN